MKIDPEIEIPKGFKKLKPNPNCPYGSYPIPDYIPSLQETARQMKINRDTIMQQIMEHVDKELKRFRLEMQLIIEEYMEKIR